MGLLECSEAAGCGNQSPQANEEKARSVPKLNHHPCFLPILPPVHMAETQQEVTSFPPPHHGCPHPLCSAAPSLPPFSQGRAPLLSLPSCRQYLHQRSGRSEAHFGHGLALAAPREAVEARAGAGEGAEGRGPRRDGRVGDAAAIGVLGHPERSPAGQGVYDLPRGAARQSIHPQTLPYQASSLLVRPWQGPGSWD